jgi:hypothetical protein
MGLIVVIDQRGHGILAAVDGDEWRVRIDEVPAGNEFCYGDVIAVEAKEPHRFLRVVERGEFQPSLRVHHSHDNADWLDTLDALGWATFEEAPGLARVAAPSGVDARAQLSQDPRVQGVS